MAHYLSQAELIVTTPDLTNYFGSAPTGGVMKSYENGNNDRIMLCITGYNSGSARYLHTIYGIPDLFFQELLEDYFAVGHTGFNDFQQPPTVMYEGLVGMNTQLLSIRYERWHGENRIYFEGMENNKYLIVYMERTASSVPNVPVIVEWQQYDRPTDNPRSPVNPMDFQFHRRFGRRQYTVVNASDHFSIPESKQPSSPGPSTQ